MIARQIAKRAVLSIPQFRRLYDHVEQLRAHVAQLEQEVSRLGGLERSMRAALATTESERQRLARDKEDLELQLYVLRSDFHRAVAHAETMRLSANEMEEALENTRTAYDAVQSERDDLLKSQSGAEAGEKGRGCSLDMLATDLEQFRVRALSRLTLLSREINGVRQALRATGAGGDQCVSELRVRYLDLLEDALTGRIYGDAPESPRSRCCEPDVRMTERDWLSHARTMIGSARMRNLRNLVEVVLDEEIEGDLLEAGVWRGAACIYMRGILAAHGCLDRKVWVADSFAGLPPSDPDRYPADTADQYRAFHDLAATLDDVRARFELYGLLDAQVEFLTGWHEDAVPRPPAQKFAILQIDGGLYQTTMKTLTAAYDQVAAGGFVIVDDYMLPACRQAVEDFRSARQIVETVEDIDGAGVYWRKSSK